MVDNLIQKERIISVSGPVCNSRLKLEGRVRAMVEFFNKTMGTRNRLGIGLSYRPARVENLSPAMWQGIDSRNRVWN